MKEYANPILLPKTPEYIDYGPQPRGYASDERAKTENAFRSYLRRHHPKLFNRYMRQANKSGSVKNSTSRWVLRSLDKEIPDPILRERRRHYIAQKWRELRIKTNTF